MGKHTLPDLPYAYNALEPHIDEQTMKLHHDIHHNGYVTGLNAAEDKLAAARASGDFGAIKAISKDAAFHGSGHFLHSIFWPNMAPPGEGGGGSPGGDLASQIDTDFGSFDNLVAHFSAASVAVEGSGWGLLVWQPEGMHLEVLQSEKHQNYTQWGVTPLLVLDVWEHAYYLNYQNKRKAYVDAWWNVVNWGDVAERFSAAKG